MEHLREIRLYGRLGARFGRVHYMAVESCAEAIRALSSQLEGFDGFMRDARKNGMVFASFVGSRNITKEQLTTSKLDGSAPLRIAPIIIGSKQAGLFQTIVGAMMIVAAVAMTVTGYGAAYAPNLAMAGASLMAGGVIQMLSPQASGMQSAEDADNAASYAFGGPVNTTAQGNIVGVLYGEREIGGGVVSAGIIANEVAV